MAALEVVNYFLPIFAFMLVFLVVYALLKKTSILGSNEPVMLFVSFILAGFFVVEASLVDFVQFSGAWYSVIVIAIFFLVLIFGLVPGKDSMEFLTKKNWISWVLVGLIVALFIISSAYVFNWAVNWDRVKSWIYTDWFGLILLVVIAFAASKVITKK